MHLASRQFELVLDLTTQFKINDHAIYVKGRMLESLSPEHADTHTHTQDRVHYLNHEVDSNKPSKP